jgi:hypothetical protein
VTPQASFTRHSLPAIARKINERSEIELPDGTIKRYDMEDYYLHAAAKPNSHIHASFWSFLERLEQNGEQMVWKEDQTWSSRFAVSTAHSLMPLVLKTQDEHFQLGMFDEIKRRSDDWLQLWAPPGG